MYRATTYATYESVARVEALDPLTVKITFTKPTPAWCRRRAPGG